VAVHALGTEGIRNAVAAGVDTVEHGVFLTEDIVESMARQGTVLCPTTAVYRRMADGQAPAYAVEKAAEVVAAHRASVSMALEAGIEVIAGTDAGAPGMPHPSLVDEIEVLIDYGLRPVDALKAATSRAADALGAGGAGRIAPGSPADLALVDGDPLADPSILRSVWGVVRRQELVHEARRPHLGGS
jgi:imidazolonepropionase-like amidohydrolase